jgi:branched-chain amino acid transport system permease protein
MDWTIFSFLLSDGLTNGVIYALVALALVLVFAVTRVIAVFIGELIMFAPLSFVLLLRGEVPGTLWLTLAVLAAWALLDLRKPRTLIALGALGALLTGLTFWGAAGLPTWALWLISLGIIVPMGPATFRLVYEPIPRASVLTYLILAVGLHLVFQGLGLVFFGPEQFRPPALLRGSVQLGAVPVSYQALFILAFALLLVGALFVFFTRTLHGKALRAAAVNRLGARLVGVSPAEAGRVAFVCAALIGGVSGMLVAPLTNAAYYMGFLLGLKGFVAAILGGLASYPLALIGALAVGVVEAYSSFAASAYKDAIVFALILPALVYLSLRSTHLGEEEE